MRQRDGKYKTALDILSMPDVTLQQIIDIVRATGRERLAALKMEGQEVINTHSEEVRQAEQYANFAVSPLAFETVEAEGKYCNYIGKQEDEMMKWKQNKGMPVPEDIVYSNETFPSFSTEELELLNKHRPATLHLASQIQGVTPYAVIYLHNHLLKRRNGTKVGKGR